MPRGQLVEIRSAVEARDAVDHMRLGTLGERLGHLRHEKPVRRLVEFGEAGRDAGLERIVPQERGAEGVDRLDLEPARRLDRGGEERAGLGEVDLALDAEPAKLLSRGSSSSIAQAPRRAKRRFCISPAAALV
jgi:hypothetical protein